MKRSLEAPDSSADETRGYAVSGGIRGALADVLAFHNAASAADSGLVDRGSKKPVIIRPLERMRLLREEHGEQIDAVLTDDVEAVADAYADIIYIALGSAIIQVGSERFARVWDEVQRANWDKVKNGVLFREDGKILKPDGWVPPDIRGAFRLP